MAPIIHHADEFRGEGKMEDTIRGGEMPPFKTSLKKTDTDALVSALCRGSLWLFLFEDYPEKAEN